MSNWTSKCDKIRQWIIACCTIVIIVSGAISLSDFRTDLKYRARPYVNFMPDTESSFRLLDWPFVLSNGSNVAAKDVMIEKSVAFDLNTAQKAALNEMNQPDAKSLYAYYEVLYKSVLKVGYKASYFGEFKPIGREKTQSGEDKTNWRLTLLGNNLEEIKNKGEK